MHFDTVRQTILLAGLRVTPDENPGIPARFDVLPFDMQDEVLILLVRTHYADRLAFADQDSFLHSPGVFVCVDVYPAREVFAVEQIAKDRNGLAGEREDRKPYCREEHHTIETSHQRNANTSNAYL